MVMLRKIWCWLLSLVGLNTGQTLYIIGNGFDMHHKMQTSYTHFGLYIQEHHPQLYEYLTNFFNLNQLDPEDDTTLWGVKCLWSDFEAGLSTLEFDEVLSEFSDYMGNPAASGKSHDWFTYSIELQRVVKELTEDLRKAFKAFILSVEYPDGPELLLQIDSKAKFFNFNYTDSLRHYYGVNKDSVLFIHSAAQNDDELVLGHGIDPEEFRPKDDTPPEGVSDEELEQWHEWKSDSYDHVYELGKNALLQYYSAAEKTTSKIIVKHDSYFQQLGNVKKVIVIGHSLADVDRPYLAKIIQSVHDCAQWEISYYSENSAPELSQALLSIGLNSRQFKLFQINELLLSKNKNS